MSDPRVPSFDAVGEEDLLLVAHDVQVFEGIRNGGILMGVRPRNDEDASYFENSWKTSRAQDVYR